MAQRKRLGDILQESGLIDADQLQEALDLQRKSGDKLGEALLKLGFVSSEQIADALSKHLRIPRAHISSQSVSTQLMKLIPDDFMTSRKVVPVELDGNTLKVAMADPLNIMIIDDLQNETGFSVKPAIASTEEIDTFLRRAIGLMSSANKVFDELEDEDQSAEEALGQQYHDDAPGVRLANLILEQAIGERASDIHFEPRENDMRIRFRVDGVLKDIMVIPRNLRADVNSRIKIMAGLDITERRRPQDGRIQSQLGGVEVDMRISTLPTVHGEKIVARLLGGFGRVLSMDGFGFSNESTRKLRRMLRQNQGLILVTGPTGSGKTTTLYGCLEELNSIERNIVTVEDPVEYMFKGLNQVQTNAKVGLTFSSGLRSVLRQDPDIIMVGEIRDLETAEIAVRAALTGHLVLSTLHTNSAVASITRLVEMGIPSYLVSSTLIGIIAQRLVRRLCQACKQEAELSDGLVRRFIEANNMPVPDKVYQGTGCTRCNGSTYSGREAIEEILVVNKSIRQAIDAGRSESELLDLAEAGGMVRLQVNAINKLAQGIITDSELVRAVYSADVEVD